MLASFSSESGHHFPFPRNDFMKDLSDAVELAVKARGPNKSGLEKRCIHQRVIKASHASSPNLTRAQQRISLVCFNFS